jgi:hypothetical protein
MFSKTFTKKMIAVLALLAFATACQSANNDSIVVPVESTKQVTVYFMDEERYAVGTEPYEVGVSRTISTEEDEAEAILHLLFEGATDEEYAEGLRLIMSGCTGFSELAIEDGVAQVYLTGDCNSQGATYTIANQISVNLKQLNSISYVKIYDQNGETEAPEGLSDSIPVSLEP